MQTDRSRRISMPILILTTRDDEHDKVLGLEFCADDYFVKSNNLSELISRIRTYLRRTLGDLANSSSREKIQFGSHEIDLEQLNFHKEGKAISLTPTEF